MACPRCGEDRQIEQIGHEWFCAVCAFAWKVTNDPELRLPHPR